MLVSKIKKINIWWKLSFIVEIRMVLQKIFHPIVMYISWRWCEQTSKSWCSDDEGVSFERRCLFIWQTRFFPVVLLHTVRTPNIFEISLSAIILSACSISYSQDFLLNFLNFRRVKKHFSYLEKIRFQISSCFQDLQLQFLTIPLF